VGETIIVAGEPVPIEDTVCECVHWYGEHTTGGGRCCAPDCSCPGFVADSELSTPAEIADRGGDPAFWPEHVKRAFPDAR
jgi:hypothetical protein